MLTHCSLCVSTPAQAEKSYSRFMGVSENVVYPIVPNGFADQTIPMKNGYISLVI